ncbi:MAG TPA: non-ribosomal peptide synthetase, partial [Methanocorpusculum sp.]|nr:non-ribosomal peptide synthetase [Methanocorpusculum sp.]
ELDEITDNLADYLCRNGVGAETVVGILIPRNEYMPICALGVLKAGGAYLPLDPSYPKDRLNFMLKDSDAVLLIADKSLDGLIDEFSGIRLFTDEIKSLPNCSSLLPKPNAKDLFAVLYTSGSTGIPKGVMLTHQNIAAFSSAWTARSHELDETARVSAYASFGFDAHIQDMYPTLITGAELHIIPEELRLDLIGLRTCFNTCGITHCDMTTQIGRQFALLGGFTSLKEQTVGGEKLVPFIPPSYAFYDTYGPTEGTVVSTAFRLESQHTNSSIGKPLDNVRCYVVDKNGMLLPPGAVGELWLSGPQVARGYLNRPEKTAEVFTKNTFSTHPAHSVVYHTGDIVRYLSDGNIQFIGRHDSQVKIRGFRIELTEIEEVICRFPGVKDAAVAAFDNPAGGKYLAAYVVSEHPVDIKALNNFISEEKPPYMVPAAIVQIDAVPYNQNMKVNRKALPVPELKKAENVPPGTSEQKRIYEIVSSVLGHTEFGITTPFPELGLDSISAVRLMILLGQEYNTSVKLADIRKYDTIEKLDEYLKKRETIVPHKIMEDYPLLETQKVILSDSEQHPETALYHIPTLIKLNKDVDILKLKAAVETVINSHPYLKSSLTRTSRGEVRIKRNDSAAPNVVIQNSNVEAIRKNPVRLYNLPDTPQLYDAVIYRTESRNYLLLDLHHIISDGVSLSILLKDISRAYAGEAVEPETYSGFDAALDEENAGNSVKYAEVKAYYDKLFSGADTHSLPRMTRERKGKSETFTHTVQSVSADDVQKYCAKHNLTVHSFFTAAFGYVLGQYAGKKQTVFYTLYDGRDDSRLFRTAAMLAKRLPLLCTIPDTGSPADFIRDMQKQLNDTMLHALCSYEELEKTYGIHADIILRYQGEGFTTAGFEIGDVINSVDASDNDSINIIDEYEVSMSPVGLSVFITGNRFSVISHRSEMYNRKFIEEMLWYLDVVLKEFIVYEKIETLPVPEGTGWKQDRSVSE